MVSLDGSDNATCHNKTKRWGTPQTCQPFPAVDFVIALMHEPRFHCTKDYSLDILPFLQLQSFTRFYINPMSLAHLKHTAPPPHNQLMPSSSLLLCIAFVIMAASVDPLVVGRVIGDVIDMFIPSVGMSVYYASKHVTNGCDIKPSMAINPPKVTLTGNMDSLYTLVGYIWLCAFFPPSYMLH